MVILKTAFSLAIIASPLLTLASARPTFAQVLRVCDTLPLSTTTITDEGDINEGEGCYKTPEGYSVKAYKLGLCPSGVNPLSSSGFDPSNCSIIWENPNGEEENLVNESGGPATFTLTESDSERPPNGVYGSAFIVIDPTIKLKATIEVGGEAHATDPRYEFVPGKDREKNIQYSLSSKTESSEFVDIRTGYLQDEEGVKSCFIQGMVVDGKDIDAAFLDTDGETVVSLQNFVTNFNSNEQACLASFIVGVQDLAAPVTITDRTTSANISFLTTNNGAWAESYNRDGIPQVMWDVGPFSIDFTVSE